MPYFTRTLVVVLGITLLGIGMPKAADLPQEPEAPSSCQVSYLRGVSPFFDQDQILYAEAGRLLMRSTDGGVTWQSVYEVPSEDHSIGRMSIAPVVQEEGLHLYLGVNYSFGLSSFYSRTHSPDGGATWEDLRSDAQALCPPVTVTNEEGTLFASCKKGYPYDPSPEGIYRSTDHGHTWQQVWSETPGNGNVAPSPDFANDQTVYAGRFGRYPNAYSFPMLSLDGGLSWQDVSPGLCPEHPETNVSDIMVSPDFPTNQTIFGLARRHLLKSEDGGASWQQFYLMDEDPCQYPTNPVWQVAFSPDYAADRTVFMRTTDGSYVSYDGGHHWRQMSRRVRNIQIRRRPEPSYRLVYLPLLLQGIASNTANPHQVFLPLLPGSGALPRSIPLTLFAEEVGQSDAYVRSDDGGITWHCVNPPSSILQNTSTQTGGGLP